MLYRVFYRIGSQEYQVIVQACSPEHAMRTVQLDDIMRDILGAEKA